MAKNYPHQMAKKITFANGYHISTFAIIEEIASVGYTIVLVWTLSSFRKRYSCIQSTFLNVLVLNAF